MNKQYYGKQHCANMKLFDKIDLLLCFVKDPVICETIVILSHRELMLCLKPKSVAATVPWLLRSVFSASVGLNQVMCRHVPVSIRLSHGQY